MEQKTIKRTPKWVIAIFMIIPIFFIVLAFAFASDELETSDTNKNNSGKTTTKPVSKEDLALEEGHTGYSDDYGFAYYIEGYIKNNTNRDYSYVQLTFNVYDAEGSTLGTCLANNSGLEANGRWKFKAICSGDAKSIASYKLAEITKW